MRNDEITTESMILLLLCSHLSVKRNSDQSLSPFSPVEWHKVKASIPDEHFGELISLSSEQMTKKFNLPRDVSFRIESLLKFGGNLALELDRYYQKGIWVLTEFDTDYPSCFRNKLKDKAPPVVFGAGEKSLVNDGGVAIVGSRDVDDDGRIFAEMLSEMCAQEKLNVISGAARGVDQISMSFALQAGGKVVGVLADSLAKFLTNSQIRESVMEGNLTAITHLHPSVGFSVAGAMSRNKLVYALSDYAVVVSSAYNSGGTWAGAIESIKHGYSVVFVRHADNSPEGNRKLIEKGAIPIPQALDLEIAAFFESHDEIFKAAEQEKISDTKSKSKLRKVIQQSLFSDS